MDFFRESVPFKTSYCYARRKTRFFSREIPALVNGRQKFLFFFPILIIFFFYNSSNRNDDYDMARHALVAVRQFHKIVCYCFSLGLKN